MAEPLLTDAAKQATEMAETVARETESLAAAFMKETGLKASEIELVHAVSTQYPGEVRIYFRKREQQ